MAFSFIPNETVTAGINRPDPEAAPKNASSACLWPARVELMLTTTTNRRTDKIFLYPIRYQ